MSALVLVGLLVAVVLWWRRRRARKRELAGLLSERPVFNVLPPARHVGRSLRGERL